MNLGMDSEELRDEKTNSKMDRVISSESSHRDARGLTDDNSIDREITALQEKKRPLVNRRAKAQARLTTIALELKNRPGQQRYMALLSEKERLSNELADLNREQGEIKSKMMALYDEKTKHYANNTFMAQIKSLVLEQKKQGELLKEVANRLVALSEFIKKPPTSPAASPQPPSPP